MHTPVLEGVVLGGRYHLTGLLGRGGMAEVYEGYDERLDRSVAVKVLRPELSSNVSVRQRFESEACTSARLAHPNVVTIYDTGEDGGRAYIVMELVRGETLADRLTRGSLDQGSVRAMAADILAGLGMAHRAGIVHRDIKPANILLTADGRAKLSDFGIAEAIQPAPRLAPARRPTATWLVVGTPGYMAPERANGQPATPQSDLYSLGVVLYESLAGHLPFGSPPAPGASADPSIPSATDPALAAGIGRALQADPHARFQTSAEMLRTLVEPRGDATHPLPAAGRRAGRRRRWLAASTAAAVLGAGGAVLFRVAHPSHGRAAPPGTAAPANASALPANSTTTVTTAATPPTSTPPTDAAATALRQVGAALTTADGSAAPQLADGLNQLADLSPDARPAAASTLLSEVEAWRSSGRLSATAYEEAVAVLTGVGAVASQPFVTQPVGPEPSTRQPGSSRRGHPSDNG